MKYFFDQDNSCHWYLVESSHREEWKTWRDLDEDDEAGWDVPSYATRIDGINSIDFENPSNL